MKLEIARGVFFIGALGVASLCAAAWSEPVANVVQGDNGLGYCPLPASARAAQSQVRPDSDLLLFMYGLSQNLANRG